MLDFLAKQGGGLLVHGQRLSDNARHLGIGIGPVPEAPSVIGAAPLAEWSDDEVQEYVDRNGLALPEQYEVGADSLECSLCPAAFSDGKGRERARYMARRYPQELKAALDGAKRALDATRMAVASLTDELAEAEMIADA